MLKPVFLVLLFYWNVMVTYQQPISLPPLPTPLQKYVTPYNSSPTTYGLSYSWIPVDNNEVNPVLGYKVKVWIPKKTKTVLITKEVLGTSGTSTFVLEESKDIDYINLDKVDYDPIITKEVLGADSSNVRIDGLKLNVTHLFRVQAYSAAGDGPLSSPFTLKMGPTVVVPST